MIEKSSDPTNAAAIISAASLLERLREAQRKRDEELVAKALPQKKEPSLRERTASLLERLREIQRKRDEELVANALPQKKKPSMRERLIEAAQRRRDEELVAKALPQKEVQELIANQELRANLQQLLHNPVAKITEAKVFSVT